MWAACLRVPETTLPNLKADLCDVGGHGGHNDKIPREKSNPVTKPLCFYACYDTYAIFH